MILLVLCALSIAACSRSDPPSQAPPKTVFDDQLETIKKARAVDGKVQESSDALKRAVDAADNGAPAAADR
jgi:hypothetical protein